MLDGQSIMFLVSTGSFSKIMLSMYLQFDNHDWFSLMFT